MTEETTTTTGTTSTATAEPTEAELKQQMDVAYKSGDYKEIARVAKLIAKSEQDKEKAERDAKLKAIEGLGDEVKGAIMKALRPLIDAKKLDNCDGVWFSFDFGESLQTIRLLKSQPKARTASSGGGGGKKFDISTDALLEKFGDQVLDKESGQTYAAAYEATSDGNKRYQIRQKLLKLGGYV